MGGLESLLANSENLEISDAVCLARGGVDALDAHLFEHPLAVDFLGGDDFEALRELALAVVTLDAQERRRGFVDPHANCAVLRRIDRRQNLDFPSIAGTDGLALEQFRVFPVEKFQRQILVGDQPAAQGVVQASHGQGFRTLGCQLFQNGVALREAKPDFLGRVFKKVTHRAVANLQHKWHLHRPRTELRPQSHRLPDGIHPRGGENFLRRWFGSPSPRHKSQPRREKFPTHGRNYERDEAPVQVFFGRDPSAGITATSLQNELLILDRKLDQEIRGSDHWNR